jgi:hypothetical protein
MDVVIYQTIIAVAGLLLGIKMYTAFEIKKAEVQERVRAERDIEKARVYKARDIAEAQISAGVDRDYLAAEAGQGNDDTISQVLNMLGGPEQAMKLLEQFMNKK